MSETKGQFGDEDTPIKRKKTSKKTWVILAVVVVVFVMIIIGIVSAAKTPKLTHKGTNSNTLQVNNHIGNKIRQPTPTQNLLLQNNTAQAIKNLNAAKKSFLENSNQQDNKNYQQIVQILQQLTNSTNNLPTNNDLILATNKLENIINTLTNSLIRDKAATNKYYQGLLLGLEQRILKTVNEKINLPKNTDINTDTNNPVFDLVSVSIWDQIAQAIIRHQGKLSIVKVGDVRLGWTIQNINFNAEQISVTKKGSKVTMEKIK